MAFDELKENFSNADASLRSYAESTKEYYQLKSFRFLMKGVTAMVKALLLGAVMLLAFFILSLAASFGIGQVLDNTFYGFLIVGVFYLFIGLIIYLLRNRLDKPLIRKFSEYYFEEI